MYGEELLRDLDDVQFHANQEVSEVMAMLDELHKNVQKLAPEKHILEAKPKIEEQEGYPLMCRQEESEFKSLQIEPCDADTRQLQQKLQEGELEREATVEEKKAMESIKEQLYAQLGKLRIVVTLYRNLPKIGPPSKIRPPGPLFWMKLLQRVLYSRKYAHPFML